MALSSIRKPPSLAPIIFENDDICVFFRAGWSADLLVTFGDSITFARERRYFAETIADEFDFNAIGFMAKTPNWFSLDSMNAALPRLQTILASLPHRIFYGVSLGAYSAIKFSRLLGATDVVALAPQWSIDPDECGPVDSGFRQLFTPAMRGMGIRPADVGGRIHILYDPSHPNDPYHFATLQRMIPEARGYYVHHGGHKLVHVLAGRQLAFDLLMACRDDDESRIYQVVNRARRPSPVRRRAVLARGAGPHPILTLRAIRQLRLSGQDIDIDPMNCLIPLCQALLKRGEGGLAQEALRLLQPPMSGTRARSIAEDIARLARGQAREACAFLKTVHGTRLYFSAIGGCLCHLEHPMDAARQVGLHAVYPQAADGVLILATSIEGAIFACQLEPSGSVDLVPLAERDVFRCFRVVEVSDNAVHIMLRNAYLTAEESGGLSRQALTADRWECFERLGQDWGSRAGPPKPPVIILGGAGS